MIGNVAFSEDSADEMLPLSGGGAGETLVQVCREEPESQDTQVLVQATAALVNLVGRTGKRYFFYVLVSPRRMVLVSTTRSMIQKMKERTAVLLPGW